MSKEKLICSFKFSMIQELSLVSAIVSLGFRSTGKKFSVIFNGSAGYLSNIEIECEGTQPYRSNVIWVDKLRNKDGSLKSKKVSVYHSDCVGIRIEIQGQGKEVSDV